MKIGPFEVYGTVSDKNCRGSPVGFILSTLVVFLVAGTEVCFSIVDRLCIYALN